MTTFSMHQGDAVEWLARQPSGSADAMVTGPAYESLEKHRVRGGRLRKWFAIFGNERYEPFFRGARRVVRQDGAMFVFCDSETSFVVKPVAEAAGFVFQKLVFWDKKHIGLGYHYRARFEIVLAFSEQPLRLPDVLRAPRLRRYPTETPASVSEALIRQSTRPGETVIDPFAGSGSVGVAAARAGRCFRGNDISSTAVALARQSMLAEGAREVADDGARCKRWS